MRRVQRRFRRLGSGAVRGGRARLAAVWTEFERAILFIKVSIPFVAARLRRWDRRRRGLWEWAQPGAKQYWRVSHGISAKATVTAASHNHIEILVKQFQRWSFVFGQHPLPARFRLRGQRRYPVAQLRHREVQRQQGRVPAALLELAAAAGVEKLAGAFARRRTGAIFALLWIALAALERLQAEAADARVGAPTRKRQHRGRLDNTVVNPARHFAPPRKALHGFQEPFQVGVF